MSEYRYRDPYHQRETLGAKVRNVASEIFYTLSSVTDNSVDACKRFVGLESRYLYGRSRSKVEVNWRRIAISSALLTAIGGGGVMAYKFGPQIPNVWKKFISPVQATEVTPTPELTAIATVTPEPTAAWQQPDQETIFAGGGVSVEMRNGMPIAYTLASGEVVTLDAKDVARVRQKARDSGEPEILTLIPVVTGYENYQSQHTPSAEHPLVPTLPEDVLTDEELAAKGITIIQSANTNLHIRSQAFTQGELLSDFAAGDKKLTVVLVDGPVVSGHFLTDPKYDPVRDLLVGRDSDIGKFQNEQINLYRDLLQTARQELAEARAKGVTGIDLEMRLGLIRSLKADIYKYQNASAEQLVEMWGQTNPEAVGMYFMSGLDGNPVVFVATGTSTISSLVEISVDPDGEFQVGTYLWPSMLNYIPQASETHPDPEDFREHPAASPDLPMSYPYGGQTPGFSLRHEISHDELMRVRPTGEIIGSEYATDMRAMDSIHAAHDRWVSSGYTDNSGYYFVFSLPGGGHILTKETTEPSGVNM